MPAGSYVSEADFCCQFLAHELRRYESAAHPGLELHLEEQIGTGTDRADLTIRRNNERLLVIEAKLEMEPWHPEVVKQAFNYGREGFRHFATCNPDLLLLFEVNSDPFRSAVALVYLDQGWVNELLELISKPSPSTSLYLMLAQEGIIESHAAEAYESLLGMRLDEEEAVAFEVPKYRLVAISGPVEFALGRPLDPDKPYPREVDRVWTVEGRGGAQEERVRLEKKGYKVKLQSKVKGRWTELDIDQTHL